LEELAPPAFARLAAGEPPAGLMLPDTPLGEPDVLAMLAGIAAEVSAGFAPCAWMVVDGERIAGLVSLVRAPVDGVLTIGYGMAPGERGRGGAGAGVAALVAWAEADPRVRAITAETHVDNVPSQRVLAINDFEITGGRLDPEDGELLCWCRDTQSPA
jgi:RimJ/RimL family protein N-acetyltransferase